MSAKILNGNLIAKDTLKYLKTKLQFYQAQPSLGICLVGDSPASRSYVNRKLKACQEIGVKANLYQFEESITQQYLIDHIRKMNEDGILVQLPLPTTMDRNTVINSIPTVKDVDCLHMHNLQRILLYGELNEMLPCTPAGVLSLLDHCDINLQGKQVTMIGRSLLVGLPLSLLLMKRNATVTICHRLTQNLEDEIMKGDIVISAAGCSNLVNNVKEGAIVIDVGINKGQGKKIIGDVNFERVSKQASIITPVPGGVGPMTVCMLMKNVYNIWCKANGVKIEVNPKLGKDYLDD